MIILTDHSSKHENRKASNDCIAKKWKFKTKTIKENHNFERVLEFYPTRWVFTNMLK